MKPTGSSSFPIAYKWLSWCLVLAVAYYWLMTIGLVFFGNRVSSVSPRQTILYRTFARQNWRLFAITKLYNRQMNFIIRDRQDTAKADTTDLIQYLLTEKRKYAPFNNYEDALDRILYIVMNGVEIQMNQKKELLKKQFPGKPADFYIQQASLLAETDSTRRQDISNIVAFGRYIMEKKKMDTTGKEYRLIIVHKYIPPAKPPAASVPGGDEQTIFISTYKSF